MTVGVEVAAAGTLTVRPAGDSLLRRSVMQVPSAGSTSVTLRPTEAGLRVLKKVGNLRVRARFTWTACGGTARSTVREYTLRLR